MDPVSCPTATSLIPIINQYKVHSHSVHYEMPLNTSSMLMSPVAEGFQ